MPEQSIITTERLYLRQFTAEDAADLYELNNDNEVLQYTGDEPFDSVADALHFVSNYTAYEKPGMGRWAVIRKEDDAFLGWCGLKYHPLERVVDLGYRLKKKYWRYGYATEAAKACAQYAFQDLKLASLVAHAHVDNSASHKVLQKIGFKYIKTFLYDGKNAFQYSLFNKDYAIRQISGKETWSVRHPVLRQGRPLEDCHFEGDEDQDTIHLGLYHLDHPVGVVSLLKKDHNYFSGTQYQLRGMAVLPEFQNKGLGELLVDEGEKLLNAKRVYTIWLNAREVAVSFYTNLDYEIMGKPFEVEPIGTHYLMHKKLR